MILPENWQRVRLVLIRSPRSPHSFALNEAMEFLLYSFRKLGCNVDQAENKLIANGPNIIFCASLLKRNTAFSLPHNCIIFNSEQIESGSPFDSDDYRGLLKRFAVWDYSARNLENLRTFVPPDRLHYVPVGYVPELTRIVPAAREDIDVLFYGSLNDRRRKILAELSAAGLAVHYVYGVYGTERDQLIARSKVVLNVHFYPTKIFEIIRVSYLLANRKAVVSEFSPDTEIIPELRDAIALAGYEHLVETCRSLVYDIPRREDLARRGFECFSRLTFHQELIEAIKSTRYEQNDRPE